MRKIVICDDDQQFMEQLETALREQLAKSDVTVIIDKYDRGAELLKRMPLGDVDAAFLDVEMPEMSGLELAGRISKSYPKTILFFVSSQEKYAFEAIKCHPMAYVRKTHLKSDLEAAIEMFIEDLKRNSITVSFVGNKIINHITVADILYVYSDGNYIIFELEDRTERVRSTLTEAEKKLKLHGFARSTSDYVVNCRKVKTIRCDAVEMENGHILPVSRSRYESLRSAVTKIWREIL